MEKAGDLPDIVIAPFGGGSNFAGLAFPFLRFQFGRGTFVVSPANLLLPKLTRGEYSATTSGILLA